MVRVITLQDFKLTFNPPALLDPAMKFRRRVFQEFGSYCRTVAKNSMVDTSNTKKVSRAGFILSGGNRQTSKPGTAAFSRLGFVKQHIYFAADTTQVTIGPAKLEGLKAADNALDVLEHGGTEQVFMGRRVRISKTAQYRPRPTMGLAFVKAIDKKLPRLIAGGIMREV